MTERECKLIQASISYYNGAPIMTDSEWDIELEILRQENPKSKIFNGLGWGYTPKDSELLSKSHLIPYLHGFDKIFLDTTDKLVKPGYYTPKYDGASITLYYKDGELDLALTRGNGLEGSDVTDKLRYVVPNKVNPNILVVSGEWILSKTEFAKLDGDPIAHRNIAVGALMRKSYDPQEISKFDFIAYRLEQSEPLKDFEGRSSITTLLSESGFNVAPFIHLVAPVTYSSIITKFNLLIDYHCDGIVYEKSIKYNNKTKLYTYISDIAYKHNMHKVETIVTGVDWNFTRTGKYVPIINYEPIEISGALCSKATAYNAAYINKTKIGEGSRAVVTRSGEVIPYIITSTPSPKCKLPEVCEKCGHKLEWSGVDLICSNPECVGKSYNLMYHYIDTIAGQFIKGVSSKVIDSVIEVSKWVKPSDIYNSNMYNIKSKLSIILGTSTYKLACQLLDLLLKPLNLSSMLEALNIPKVGYTVASKVSPKLGEYLESGVPLTQWKLQDIQSIGPSIESMITNNSNLIIETYEAVSSSVGLIKSQPNQIPKVDNRIKVSISGKLPSGLTKGQFYAKYIGLITESSVESADYLISNKTDSSKTKTARKLGVKILSENDFLKDVILN